MIKNIIIIIKQIRVTMLFHFRCLIHSSATDLAKAISGSDSIWRGYYVNTFDKNRIVTFPRYPNCHKDLASTAFADALVAELNSVDDFKNLLIL